MGFLAYFFVLLLMASSVLFAMDWVNAPLRPPAQVEQARLADSAPQQKPDRPAQRHTAGGTRSVLLGAATQGMASSDEPPSDGRQVETAASPAPATAAVTQATPAPVPTQQAPQAQDQAQDASTQEAAKAPPAPAPKADSARASEGDHSAAVESQARRTARVRTAQEKARRQHAGRAPSWATRGAEAARREAQDAQARAPFWAIQGAQAVEREGPPRPPPRMIFRPFWEPQGGWHFP